MKGRNDAISAAYKRYLDIHNGDRVQALTDLGTFILGFNAIPPVVMYEGDLSQISISSDPVGPLMPFTAQPSSSTEEGTFQQRVGDWMDKCFKRSLYSDMVERGDRFLEEAIEMLQAHDYPRERIPTLVDYVYNRPKGESAQEVGGVMITLAGFCHIAGHDMQAEGERELARINRPEVMKKIRAKQEAKNALHFDSPLPGSVAPGSTFEIPAGFTSNLGMRPVDRMTEVRVLWSDGEIARNLAGNYSWELHPRDPNACWIVAFEVVPPAGAEAAPEVGSSD
jgi:hypothetical protein